MIESTVHLTMLGLVNHDEALGKLATPLRRRLDDELLAGHEAMTA
jgi:hypothetical protein